jgi:aminopeptidase N
VPVRVLAPPGHADEARAALDMTSVLLHRMQDYLGVSYPFPKLDVVAVQKLAIYGMENAAAIFIRASELLAISSTQTQMQRLAHELAHQWFGDLVTMASWKDLWLSEALARWAEFEVIDRVRPDWQMWTQFQRLRDRALSLDARSATHAIRSVGRPIFDEITYNKGAAALWMLRDWMGDDAFRAALRDYLHAHEFGVATADDFWQALAAHSDEKIAAVGRSWFDQAGHPTIEVESACTDGALRIRIKQQREGEPSGQIWQIPLALETPTGPVRLIMRGPEQTLLLREAGGCPSWVRVEPDTDQPYRIYYAARSARVLSASSPRPPPPMVTSSPRGR